MEKLENNFAQYQISAVEKLTQAVSHKFNAEIPKFLPNINKKLNELTAFKETTELKAKTDAEDKEANFGGGGGLDSIEVNSLKMIVNNLKTEMDYQKKTFSVQKLQLIDQRENKVRNLTYEMEVTKMNMDSYAAKSELTKLTKSFDQYAQIS